MSIETEAGSLSDDTFRVLCVDGGGMRGIYTAAYLAELLRLFSAGRKIPTGIDLGSSFNLIAGTSTGAIIGLALAVGIQPRKIVDLYRLHGPSIFPKKLPTGLTLDLALQLVSRSKYLAAGDLALKKALDAVFGDLTLGELYAKRQIGVAIPAVEMSNHHAWVFKTPHLENSIKRDDLYTISDVCRATSAAPLYRSLAAIDNPQGSGHRVFADGGLYANTPVMVGLVDAVQMTEPGQRIEIYGLGNCKRPEGRAIAKEDVHLGLLDWKFGGGAASLAIDAQEDVSWNIVRLLSKHLSRDIEVIRFPVGAVSASSLGFLDLDETSDAGAEALIAQAQSDANQTLSDCADKDNATGRKLDALLRSARPAESQETI